jgi:hypothetical protein
MYFMLWPLRFNVAAAFKGRGDNADQVTSDIDGPDGPEGP